MRRGWYRPHRNSAAFHLVVARGKEPKLIVRVGVEMLVRGLRPSRCPGVGETIAARRIWSEHRLGERDSRGKDNAGAVFICAGEIICGILAANGAGRRMANGQHGPTVASGGVEKLARGFSRKGAAALSILALGMRGLFNGYAYSLFREHGAYVDALTLKKQTPLHLAAETGQLEVCRLLIGLRANPDAADERGQKPIHLAAQNNHAEVIKLFLKHQNSLVTSSTKLNVYLGTFTFQDGSTCAHLAAMQGSVAVLEELMKFDKTGVINARNRSTDATALQLAAEGGHADLVKALMDAGASASDENRAGYTAVHLAAKNGHTNVLEALRNSEAIGNSSRKLGMTALHIAAFYGQTGNYLQNCVSYNLIQLTTTPTFQIVETVRELLQNIPATSPTEPPLSVATSFIKELGTESGLTPLHMASYSGEENVVRLLLNFEGVQVDAPTTNLGFNPLHLACRGGHTTVVGLLLSRSSELLESKDASGKSSLHIASVHGHKHMVEVLLGQGAEIDAIDKSNSYSYGFPFKELWTPLICASKAGHLDTVKLLMESGASPLAKTSKGHSAIWFAAAENHNDVLSYLMKKEHDTYGLMDDKEVIYMLTINIKQPVMLTLTNDVYNVSISQFVFNLTICGKNIDNEPIDEFVLSSPAPVDVAAKLSNILVNLSSKEEGKGSQAASKHCESMAAELLALASVAESAGKVLESIDRKGVEFLDVLIENEQKEVIAHTVVQRHLQEIWVGHLTWADWKLLLLFFTFVFVPPVWIAFSLPFVYVIPHLSHSFDDFSSPPVIIYPVFPIRQDLFPFWFEWMLLAWLTGLLVAEIMNPSDKGGLGWIKVAVLLASRLLSSSPLPLRPWAYQIKFDKDLPLGCLLFIIPFIPEDKRRRTTNNLKRSQTDCHREDAEDGDNNEYFCVLVLVTPIDAFELLFFALFGLNGAGDLKIEVLGQPDWTLILFKVFFGVYMLVTVVVLINLLIAMMSDTYQRIQAQSDIEWKYGLAKLIRSMHRTSATPSPLNLITSWIAWIYKKCKKARGNECHVFCVIYVPKQVAPLSLLHVPQRKKPPLEALCYATKDGHSSSKTYPLAQPMTTALVLEYILVIGLRRLRRLLGQMVTLYFEPFNPLKWEAKGSQGGQATTSKFMSFKEKPTPRQRWQQVFKKTQMTPRVSDIMRLSVAQVSPMVPGTPLHGGGGVGSTLSVGTQQRIETVTDWPLIAKKYRLLVGKEEPVSEDSQVDQQNNRKDSTQGSSMMLMGKYQQNTYCSSGSEAGVT
ncbi:Ankyrin-3 [Orchesella cincta]|uniref:Ankyrin-3 n=1 Tax=Orchesella cincta TaxID=48709 RepID=A0A1D2ML26_ORCCI|nr:Ankyrin-3 [Orchesella cincta]